MPSLAPAVPRPGDLLFSLFLVALSQIEVWSYGAAGGSMRAAATQAAIAGCVAWRSRLPLTSVLGVIGSGFLCAAVTGESPASATFATAVIVGLFTLGALPDRRRAVAGLGVGLVVGVPMTQDGSVNTYLAIVLTSFVVPWLVGFIRRRQLEMRELEGRRAFLTQMAVEAERLRLARELHDVVSHNVGMIVVQASAADVLLDKDPDRARNSLRAIEQGARETLMELRRLLGLLRTESDDRGQARPSLDMVDGLVAAMGTAGVCVGVHREGPSRTLETGLDLTAYRIIQEALTNVLAHAGRPCRAEVLIDFRGPDLVLEVVDDGRGAGAPGEGFGLAGIAERVAQLGGDLDAGPGRDGGFRVRARLPLVPA